MLFPLKYRKYGYLSHNGNAYLGAVQEIINFFFFFFFFSFSLGVGADLLIASVLQNSVTVCNL